MAEAPEKNLVLNGGEDYSAVGEFRDDNGNNIDISGDTLKAEVRQTKDGALIATFSFTIFQDAGDIDPNTDQGKWKYERTMAQSVINGIAITEGFWDQFRTSGGLTSKNLQGKVTITDNVTDPTV
jgi:hypothetical protein